MKLLNWLLYKLHRWVGLALAIFMFIWFVSGLVIMYSPPITQSRSQLLAHAEILAPELGWLCLGEAWERSAQQRSSANGKAKPAGSDLGGSPAKSNNGDANAKPSESLGIIDARLVRSAALPFWLVEDSRGQRFALSALDGSVHKTSTDEALTIAEIWYRLNGGKGSANPRFLETVENPVILRNQEALKPFHKIAIGDDGGELLVSARTGEVFHASNTLSRTFYLAGNWIHLLKPLESLGWGSLRHDVQVWLGFAATLGTLTGLIIGWLRWRPGFGGKPTYSQGRTQPYREFWFKWHFWSGLLGGSVALFWALSGYIITNPGKLFSQTNANKTEIARFAGNELPEVMRLWQPTLPLELAASEPANEVVELSWRRIGNNAVLLANTRDGKRIPQTLEGAHSDFDAATIQAALTRVDPKTPVSSQIVLNEYDNYYYPRHNQSAVERPLPVIVARMADASGTRYYLDPVDGRILSKLDRSARLYRWLYSALHHWDFGWLHHRPVWDVWMLTWVGFGLVLGFSSLIMGWRLLKKTLTPKKTGGPCS